MGTSRGSLSCVKSLPSTAVEDRDRTRRRACVSTRAGASRPCSRRLLARVYHVLEPARLGRTRTRLCSRARTPVADRPRHLRVAGFCISAHLCAVGSSPRARRSSLLARFWGRVGRSFAFLGCPFPGDVRRVGHAGRASQRDRCGPWAASRNAGGWPQGPRRRARAGADMRYFANHESEDLPGTISEQRASVAYREYR